MPEETNKRVRPVIEEVVEELPKENVAIVEEPKPLAQKDSKRMNLKLVVVITVVSSLVAAFVSGGVYVYLSGLESLSETRDEQPEETITPSPTPESTATPEPETIDVTQYKVQVLNGSGAIGAAGVGEEILTEAGFNISATGNAGNYNFKSTTIQVKSTVPAEVVNHAKKALEDSEYEVEIGQPLPTSSSYEMVVTIGPA